MQGPLTAIAVRLAVATAIADVLPRAAAEAAVEAAAEAAVEAAAEAAVEAAEAAEATAEAAAGAGKSASFADYCSQLYTDGAGGTEPILLRKLRLKQQFASLVLNDGAPVEEGLTWPYRSGDQGLGRSTRRRHLHRGLKRKSFAHIVQLTVKTWPPKFTRGQVQDQDRSDRLMRETQRGLSALRINAYIYANRKLAKHATDEVPTMPKGHIFASKVTLIEQERRREKRRREEERNEAVRLKQDLLGRRTRVIGEAVVNSGWRLRNGDDAESPPGSDSESTLESERKTPSESEGWEQIERRRAQQERAEDLNLLQFEEGLRNRGLAKAISDIFKVRIEIWAQDDIDKAKVYISINPSEPSDKVVMLCYYYGLHYDALITVDDLHGEEGEEWEEWEERTSTTSDVCGAVYRFCEKGLDLAPVDDDKTSEGKEVLSFFTWGEAIAFGVLTRDQMKGSLRLICPCCHVEEEALTIARQAEQRQTRSFGDGRRRRWEGRSYLTLQCAECGRIDNKLTFQGAHKYQDGYKGLGQTTRSGRRDSGFNSLPDAIKSVEQHRYILLCPTCHRRFDNGFKMQFLKDGRLNTAELQAWRE
ncbi:hypothetical protein B484DRAFT_429698, partial [Ochromonadaceae sp. CCMP2298]